MGGGGEAHIVHQHALNAILQRHGAGVTCSACPPQLEQNIAILKAPILDIAAILLNRRPDPRLQQLLDHADHLAVVLVIGQAVHLATRLGALAVGGGGVPCLLLHDIDNPLPARNGLGDERKHLGPNVRPVRIGVLGHGDEVGAVEDGLDAVNVHELRGEWGRVGGRDGASRVEVLDEGGGEVLGEDAVVGEELEGVGVWRAFGLDEDGSSTEGGGGCRWLEEGWSRGACGQGGERSKRCGLSTAAAAEDV